MFAIPIITSAQSYDRNYVLTRTYLSAGSTNHAVSVQYFDGLGRPTLSVSNGVGQNNNHVYTLTEYDKMGRDSVKWLASVGGNNPDFTDDIHSVSAATYTDSQAYSVTSYDALNRPLFVSTPGEVWNGKGKTVEYITNGEHEVKYFYTIDVESDGFIDGGYYAPCTLTGEVSTDEDGHSITVFKNKRGDVVMERMADDIETYYVYSYSGLLRFVLTPEYFQHPEDEGTNKHMYSYKYNEMNLCIEKALPGCEATTYVYDNRDRAVITQDPLLREKGLYRFMLYDDLGRLAIQGTTTTYDSLQVDNNIVTKATGGTGHSNTGYYFCQPLFPDGFDIEIINYYDDYAFFSHSMLSSTSFHDNLWNENYVSANNSTSAFSKGSMTGQIVATSDGNMLYNVFYYDQKGRVIDERHTTLSNKVYKVLTDYSFTDKPISVTKVIPVTGGQLSFRPTSPGNATDTYTLTTKYTYNQYNDQLEAVWVEHDNDSTCVSQITYNNLGQIQSEMRPEISDAVSYEYDLHGWTKSIDSDYFKERLHYADGYDTGCYCYNGDISSQLWMNADTAVWRGYKFKYNDRDMLYQSSYGEGENLTLNTGRYNENITEFNSNGAIVRLTRRGKTNSDSYGIIDYLIYDYDGNKVTGIRDRYPTLLSYNGAFEYRNTHTATAAEPDFEYNSAGMLIKDRDKGIFRITYNNIGLVDSIFFDNGARIAYVYSMTGEKLKVTHWTAMASTASTTIAGIGDVLTPTQPRNIKTTEYIGGDIEAESQSLIYGSAYKYHFGNGYVRFYPGSTQIPQYYYYTADHLGNIRSVVTKNHSTNEITEVQQTAYYPFGGIIADLSTGRSVQNHLYNGKELDTSNNLWWYDYGARQYDPTRGQFTTPDPLAEKYYPWNYYTYCVNNPIKYIDPDGRACGDPPGNIISGFFHGTWDAFKESVDAVLHIGQTVTNVANAVCHPVETFDNISASIKDDYNKFTSGDAITQSNMVGKLAGDIAIGYLGGSVAKVTSKAAKAVSNGSKIARNSEVLGTGAEAVSKHIGAEGVSELGNFSGKVSVIKTTDNVTMSRYYGGNAAPIGRYLSNGAISTTVDRAGLAIKPQWNSMDNVATVLVPSGTTMIKGTTASQGLFYPGGRTQYFAPSTIGFTQIK